MLEIQGLVFENEQKFEFNPLRIEPQTSNTDNSKPSMYVVL